MNNYLIPKELSEKVLMIGVYWKGHAPGGVSSVVNTYAENFETMNYIVTAASRDESKVKKLLAGVTGLCSFCWQMMMNRRVKIVHVQGSHGASFDRKKMFVKIAKWFGKKVVWHMHASQFVPFYEGRKDKEDIVRCLNMADTLIVLSKYYQEFYTSIGVKKEKIVILDNLVPKPVINDGSTTLTTSADDDNPSTGSGQAQKRLHLLFLGEISHRKGAFDIVQAVKEHPELKYNVEIRIGGNGETEKLVEAIREAGLEECVKFEGWVGAEKKIDLLNWADVYILPSFNEGLPISILEALSYSCPIISTPVGGIPEVVLVNDNDNFGKVNGILVEPGNTEEIAKAMAYYVEQPEKVKEHGAVSGEIIKRYYPEAVFAKLREIYVSLLR